MILPRAVAPRQKLKTLKSQSSEFRKMAKSLRCKREKRLRAIRRDMVEPLYEKKYAAKLAAQEAALAAPKLPLRSPPNTSSMEVTSNTDAVPSTSTMDTEMNDGDETMASLKPSGGIGKKSKRKFKVSKGKHRGKGGKPGRRHI